jgi:hypothetical protein
LFSRLLDEDRILACGLDVPAHAGSHFDDGLVHLGFGSFFQPGLTLLDDFRANV